jgi:hypothetical protein
MSRGLEVHCPICKLEVGLGFDCKTQEDVSQALAQHIVREHTKRQGPKTVIQVPAEQRMPLAPLPGNRASRRRADRHARGNSYGRRAR